ncbi:endonuclease/exonuclease/phosphatase family protein [Belnapia rosea]|uniref:Metal-dependent hydrolase, endonuclease/exonuclease/phosphatase family n=1 Tax=Belnapia rosea TaxID=938405 RepID=A0A1G6WWI0_9PROT|nr:endonuclease/exonuclease/phosphatase family protein [Belnapia rosea]SDD70258.1 Metal-dependent hydrolase, endonuclease/exonuclease/phosphatase family [Belnapia rosea]
MLVATYNIHRGRAPGGLRDSRTLIQGVVAEIAPDLIALQEAQPYFRRGTPMLDAAALARDLDLCPLPIAERPGHQGWRSNVVLIRRGTRLLSPPRPLRLGGMEPRGAVLAELDAGWGPFRLIATHLSLGGERRRLQARALLAAIEAGPAMPTLLLGDLNEWRPGASALGVLAPFFGTPPAAPTFPAFHPVASLDRILAHPRALVPRVEVHDTPLARRASDHLPLVARLDLSALSPAASAPAPPSRRSAPAPH